MTEMEQGPTRNKMALVSVISAAVGWVLGGLSSCAGIILPPIGICGGIVFLIGNVVGVVTGYLGRKQIRESMGEQTGEGMGLTGLILGGLGTVLAICALVIVLILVVSGPAIGTVFSNIISDLETQP